jgi:hypothetical protein
LARVVCGVVVYNGFVQHFFLLNIRSGKNISVSFGYAKPMPVLACVENAEIPGFAKRVL